MAKSESDLSASVLAGSDVIFDFYCQPCSTEKLHLEAAGYCQHCQEYLCDNCFKCHRKSTASRHHSLLDNANMPRTKMTPSVLDVLTDACPKHKDKVLEYFCNVHKVICCSVCLTMDHISCQNKSYVPDVSDGTATSREYKDLVTELDRLVAMATSEQMRVQLNDQDNDAYRSKAVANIKACRKQVDTLLDKIEEGAVQNVTVLHRKNSEIIKSATQRCQSVLSDVKALATSLKEKAKAVKNNQLFVQMKLLWHRLPAMEDEIRDVTDRKFSRYEFDQDEKVQEMMTTLSAKWSLSVRPDGSDTKARYLREVNVKTAEDAKDCYVNGIAVLTGDRMVLTDCNNPAIKLVDVKLNKVTSRLSLQSYPYDIIRTKVNQVAVALSYDWKIEIFTVSNVLSRSHTIKVPGDGFVGLCYDGEKFIILYEPAHAVKTVDMTGRVLSTVYTDSANDPLFKRPCNITLGRDKDVVYITDYVANTVTSMTLRGQVISVYRHDSLKHPQGVTVDLYGRLYVCSRNTDTVHQLSATGELVQVLLDKQRGLAPGPFAIALVGDRLYISSHSAAPQYQNYVRMFQLELTK